MFNLVNVLHEVTPAQSMADILTTLGSVFTQMITWMTSLITFVVSQPYLLIGLGLMITGAAIKMLHKVIRNT